MKIATNFQDLPDLLADLESRPLAEQMPVLLRMLAEIHAAVCQPSAAPEPRVEKPKPKKVKFSSLLLDCMSPGRPYIAENFLDFIQEKGYETTVNGINNALIRLATDGKVIRIRSGIYKLPDKPEPTLSIATVEGESIN